MKKSIRVVVPRPGVGAPDPRVLHFAPAGQVKARLRHPAAQPRRDASIVINAVQNLVVAPAQLRLLAQYAQRLERFVSALDQDQCS